MEGSAVDRLRGRQVYANTVAEEILHYGDKRVVREAKKTEMR